ncbi:hypothetical protein UFOVP1551_27 [uncultured Caudovirales phage]|uniref:Uncharacterized protein n=1 Tax=uncultured Caudovirales phage TaxID=2100421 RepID=A0A6J7XMT9_9CAUD|nr:hypothetical protein UFOVP1551_27 [uncultured Caudovirales phage]
MADKVVSFELLIDVSASAKTVGDLKKSIKDLKNAALEAGETSPVGRKFLEAAGQASDRLSDMNAQVNAFKGAGEKFATVTKVVGGLAAGFQAAQGAAALFGSSGEDLQKVLVKVQAATALAQGAQALAGITDEIGAVKKIALATASNVASAATATYSTVVGVATGKIKIATLAQEAWNLAMSLNPIGLIITAIGLMAVGITQLIIAETDEEKALKAVNKQLQLNNLERDRDIESIKIQQANYQKASQNELKLMQLNGATQEEINAKKFSQFAKLEDLNNKLILQERKKIENNEDLIAALPAIQSRTAEQVETYNNLSKEIDKSNLAITALIFSNEDLAISTQTLSNEVNGVVESEKEYNAVKQQQLDHLKALSDAGQVGSIGYYNFLLGESNSKLEKLVPGSAAYNAELEKQIDLTTKLEAAQGNAYLSKLQRDGQKPPEVSVTDSVQLPPEKQEELDFNAAFLQLQLEQEIAFEDNKKEIHKKAIEERKALTKIDINEAIKLAEQSAKALQGLGDAVFANKLAKVKKGGAEEQKIYKQQFEFNKKMQLAGAVIDGAKAIVSSLSQSPVAIGPVPNPAGIASLALVAVSTAASIAKIAATKFESSGGGSTTAPTFNASAPDVNASVPALNQPTTNLTPPTTPPPTQVYVTETDIKRVGNRVNVIESRARFG